MPFSPSSRSRSRYARAGPPAGSDGPRELYWVKHLDEALVELENELKIDPRHPNASYEIVDISYKRGQLLRSFIYGV